MRSNRKALTPKCQIGHTTILTGNFLNVPYIETLCKININVVPQTYYKDNLKNSLIYSIYKLQSNCINNF